MTILLYCNLIFFIFSNYKILIIMEFQLNELRKRDKFFLTFISSYKFKLKWLHLNMIFFVNKYNSFKNIYYCKNSI